MELDIKKAIEKCKELVSNKGACKGSFPCKYCPGSNVYNRGIICTRNGWVGKESDNYTIKEMDSQTLISCKNWLLKNDKPLDNIYVEL
jgi:hypothetical protein